MVGYQRDAHSLVNHTLVPRSQVSGRHLIDELFLLADEKPELQLQPMVQNISKELAELLSTPETFIGKAEEKALEIVKKADTFLAKYNQRKEATKWTQL
jgi:N-acyl-D-aspartate/D-glutamate deacylase